MPMIILGVMMNFIEILLIVFGSLWLLGILLYIPKFISWGMGFKTMPRLYNKNKSRIALIIPAKDESDTIAPLFDLINEQTYDQNYFDTFLVVDTQDPSVEEPTVAIAKNKLKNLEYLIEPIQNCKGEALKNMFEYLLKNHKNKYDAYIIVDADNILTPTFVEEMNNALVSGADVIIGKKLIKNWKSKNKKNRNLIANISALTYTAIDTMSNKYRTLKGYSISICGQGVLLTNKFINHFNGFPFTGLTEDIELNIEAILNDFPQYYYEYAQLYSEEPLTLKEYNKRRYRWLKGYSQCMAKYHKKLMQKTFCKEKIELKNFNFMFALYPVGIMFVTIIVAFLTFLISGIVLSAIGSPIAYMAWWSTLGSLGLCYIMLAIFSFIQVIEDFKTNKMSFWEKLAVIFIGPFILAEYGIIFLRVINKNFHVKWDHVKRIRYE